MRSIERIGLVFTVTGAAFLFSACGDDDDGFFEYDAGDASPGSDTGGRLGSGGRTGSGGRGSGASAGNVGGAGSGGRVTTGGASGSGGEPATGGASGSGGRRASGGTSADSGMKDAEAGAVEPDGESEVDSGDSHGEPDGGPDASEASVDATVGSNESGADAIADSALPGVPAVISDDGGGTLEIDGARLVFSGDSVGVDVTIYGSSTASKAGLPREADIRSRIFDFSPSGTIFQEPGLVTVPVNGSPPPGKTWQVAWLDEDSKKWIPLPSILLSAFVMAPVAHFTRFAVLEVSIQDTSGGCSSPAACGGSPAEHYDLGGVCLSGAPPSANPLPFCPTTSTGEALPRAGGVLDFDASEGTFFSSVTLGVYLKVSMQKDCVDTIQEGTTLIGTCRDLEEAFVKGVYDELGICVGDRSVSCDCYTLSSVQNNGDPSGTFTTDGTSISFHADGAGESSVAYCVQGNEFFHTDGDQNEYVYME